MIGSIDDCLAQEKCLSCFNKLIHSYVLKTEGSKALQALALVPKIKFDSEPIDKLIKVLTSKQHKISEMEDAITILTRLSNPESNFVVGQGLQTVKLITAAVLNGCTAGTHHVLGEAVDFVVICKGLLAMLKGFAIGDNGEVDAEDQFTYYVTEIKSKSSKIMSKHGVVWSKKELDTPAMKFIFGAADAAIKLERMFEHLTALLKRTLGLLISQEHAEICRVLMEAHYAEEWPQVEFTLLMVFLMHRAAIGWWRAAMEFHISRSTYLQSNFGDDLLWVCMGTSTERPMLYISRKNLQGEYVWPDFIDQRFFKHAR